MVCESSWAKQEKQNTPVELHNVTILALQAVQKPSAPGERRRLALDSGAYLSTLAYLETLKG